MYEGVCITDMEINNQYIFWRINKSFPSHQVCRIIMNFLCLVEFIGSFFKLSLNFVKVFYSGLTDSNMLTSWFCLLCMNRLTGTGPGGPGSSGGLSESLDLSIISPQSIHSQDKLSSNRRGGARCQVTHLSHMTSCPSWPPAPCRQEVRFYCR